MNIASEACHGDPSPFRSSGNRPRRILSWKKATSFQTLASSVTDPRQQAKVLHPLDEILLPVLCGVMSGCETFVDIGLYGEERLKFLRDLAPFEHGTPSSHDTLSAAFWALGPDEFGMAFSAWAAGLAGRISGLSSFRIEGGYMRDKISLRGMRKKAGWNNRFLLQLLAAWRSCDSLGTSERRY